MRRNMNQWACSILQTPHVETLPIMTYPGLALTGRSILDAVNSPADQAAIIEHLAARYPAAAAVTMMDLSLEAEAFGAQVAFSEKEVPTVQGRLVANLHAARALLVPEVGAGRTGNALEATEMAVAAIEDRPVFGGQIGPYSLAGRLLGLSDIVLASMRTPEVVHSVLEKCTAFLIEFARAIKRTGANGLLIAEPAAGLLSPRLCDTFSSTYVKQVVDAVQDAEFLVILHNCGNSTHLVKSMLSTGASALHVGNAVKMPEIARQMPSDRLVMGNIEPGGVFKIGTTSQVRDAVLTLLDQMRQFPNFVLSSGCDIPPGAPLENLDAFFAALAEHNQAVAA
jgi:uroporphyrinogen decarboxylase